MTTAEHSITSFAQRPASPNTGRAPQAGMGIASLVLAIISLLSIGVLVTVVATAGASFHAPQGEDSPFSYLIGTWILVVGLLSVVGIVFGIGGLRQADRRHTFAVIGLCANIAIPLGLMFILLLAMSVDPPARHHHRTSREVVPQSVDEDSAWASPTARFWQAATSSLFISFCLYIRNKRRARRALNREAVIGFITCATCRKQMPGTSRFCRRCGAAIACS
jgi:hypothetical protein